MIFMRSLNTCMESLDFLCLQKRDLIFFFTAEPTFHEGPRNRQNVASDVFWGIHEQQAVKLVFFAPFGLLICYTMRYGWLPYLGSDFVRRIGLLMLLLLFFLLKLIPVKKCNGI